LYVHAFLDGRDTAPTSGAGYLRQLEEKLTEARNPRDTSGPLSLPDYRIASVMGRYWAMDRDKRWDRTKKAHEALVRGRGLAVDDVVAALEQRYQEGISDEFIEPLIVGAPAPIQPGDTVIFFNFRPDRARQLTATLLEDPDLSLVTLTEYDPELKGVQVAFPKTKQTDTLADVLSAAGLRQLHIAETEKYAHVTFFLNGGEEEPKVGEQRILIPSPKVATYDLQPEMSAVEVTDTLLEAIETDAADVYIVNYANGDMVGHTGIMEAAAKAVETVDTQLGRVAESILHRGGALLITADHGNAEQMAGMDALTPHTAHTTNSVPLILAGTEARALAPGRLSDVAPTLLKIIGLDAPKSWTGRNLVIN
jgi:2,3-bisphosphoglycerate-independent phosphoglycerate mutase